VGHDIFINSYDLAMVYILDILVLHFAINLKSNFIDSIHLVGYYIKKDNFDVGYNLKLRDLKVFNSLESFMAFAINIDFKC
jgi:hypothetical protein